MKELIEDVEKMDPLKIYRHPDNDDDCLRDSYSYVDEQGKNVYLVNCAIPIEYSENTRQELEAEIKKRFGDIEWKIQE